MCVGGPRDLNLPHACDLYRPNEDGSQTLVCERVPCYMEVAGIQMRNLFTYTCAGPLALLRLPIVLENWVRDGDRVYWRNRRSWWTVRGTPEVRTRYDSCVLAVVERDEESAFCSCMTEASLRSS